MGPTANGSPNTFDIEQNMRDIDRKIQGKMFTQPALKTWGIFYADRDAKTAQEFKSTMNECLKTCGYEGSDPNMCQVKPGMKFDAWKKELVKQLNDGVQMVVMILAGTKARCPLYDDLKKFLLEEYPIPSQVVLNSTISKGKNLRSIVSKILIQMNAKVGGVPWAVDNLPFMSTPTMIMGMDVFHSTALGKKSVLALTASMNQSATTYWSTSATQDEIGQEAANNLQNGMKNAMEAFKKNNGAYPARVIFYRDGVGEGQVQGVCVPEIDQIKAAIKAAGVEAKLMYINTCKRVNTRIFGGAVGRFTNPAAGTVIDSTVVDKNTYEFYLVSVAAK